jgi:hypothetical protein
VDILLRYSNASSIEHAQNSVSLFAWPWSVSSHFEGKNELRASKEVSQIYVTKLFMSVPFKILWYTDPLQGNDREANNETTAVARHRPARNNGNTVGSNVFYVVCSEATSHDRPSSVQLVSAVQLSTAEWSELAGQRTATVKSLWAVAVRRW